LDKLRIGGLPEVIKTMVDGEKKVVWIPASVAFGPNLPPGAPAGGIVVEVELVSFKEGVPPPPVPADVAAVPADAEKTASGLASKVLSKGSGKEHPKATDKVTVHYSGWTLDGKLFDSSVTRGEPSQLMVKGEKRRFWIPAGLAYGENPGGGRPGGMLVFDIELFEIQK
jgi:peptidylprolyl isomerase